VIGVQVAGGTGLSTTYATNIMFNMMATNNVDGIVFGKGDTGSTGSTGLAFWDPVSGVTGIIDLTKVNGYITLGNRFNYSIASGAAYDNDKTHLMLISSLTATDPSEGAFMYRVSFLPYQTGTVPVAKTIDFIRMYDDDTLGLTPIQNDIADIAWDPNSKRIYVTTEYGNNETPFLRYGYVDRIRNNGIALGNGLAIALYNQSFIANPPIFNFTYQITFSNDGTVLFAYVNNNDTIYTINLAPVAAVFTYVAARRVTLGESNPDISVWPATLKLT
jgi:hypothetical protein